MKRTIKILGAAALLTIGYFLAPSIAEAVTKTSKHVFTSVVTLAGTTTISGATTLSGTTTVSGGLVQAPVQVTDADTTILAANSGKVHVVANVSADRTLTLPAEVDGLVYEFVADVAAADGHDWIFDTGSDTNYFTGGVIHLDADAGSGGDEVVGVGSDLDSNSKLQINLPDAGTRIKFVCDGTTWNVSGVVNSATAPAFADQS